MSRRLATRLFAVAVGRRCGAAALGGDIDFAEDLYGRIRDAEIRQDLARMLYDTLHEVAPERAERYRAIPGVTHESNTLE